MAEPMLMSDVKDGYYVVDEADKYNIRIVEPGEHQVLILAHDVKRTPGLAKFTHPNIIRTRTRVEELKHAKHDWRKHTITKHVVVVPRDRILMLPIRGNYTFPHVEIGGQEIVLNTSGGTCGDGWTDRIYTIEDMISPNKTGLLAIANAAVRGTSFEPFLFQDEIEEAFYAEHANDWLVYSAIGRCSWVDIPEDMVKVTACIGGFRSGHKPPPSRVFLMPKAEYHTRGNLSFVLDPLKYQEILEPAFFEAY